MLVLKRGGALLLVVAACVVVACSDDVPVDEPCADIPAGGCPLARGVACEDPACDAVYACRSGGRWELDHSCPPHDGGAKFDAGNSAGDARADAETQPVDAAVDAPEGAYGGPGCEPLQPPDCTVGFALACPSGCCGCEDLFVCKDDGWTAWGSCSEGADGGITPL